MIGLSDLDFHAPAAAADFRAVEKAIMDSGEPLIDREELVIDAHGARKWVLSTKIPLRNQANQVCGLVGVARDITARKLAEALRDGQAHILEMIATSAPLATILDHPRGSGTSRPGTECGSLDSCRNTLAQNP